MERTIPMTNSQMLNTAKQVALDYINNTRPAQILPYELEDMYIVWFCKTIQNWKALVSTDVVNGMYFEVTYNGDKNETYLDVYQQKNHITVGDDKND